MIGRLTRRLNRLAASVKSDDGRFDAWRVTGTEIESREPFGFIYAGLERHLNYFIGRAMSDGASVTPLGRISPEGVEVAAANHPGVSMIVYEAGSAKKNFNPPVDFKIPVWITVEIGLEGDAEALRARPEFADARRFLKKYPIGAEFGRTREDFDEFFTGMYDPYIRKTKGAAAFVEDREVLLDEFKNGEILFIRHEGKRVGGLLMTLSGASGRLYCLGFTPEGEELARAGLVGAMYLLSSQRLLGRGCRRASFGFTKSFLTDGAMRFKARLGARVAGEPHAESGFLYCRLIRGTQALKSFLKRHPFVSRGNGGYEANYFVDDASSLDTPAIRDIVKDRFLEGIDLVNLFSFQGLPPGDVLPPSEKGIRLVRVHPSPVAVPAAFPASPALV